MSTKKLYSSQIILIVLSVLEIIATFLPAAKVYGQSINLVMPGGSMGAGVFFIALAVITILLALLKKKIGVLIITLLGAVLGFQQFFSLKSQFPSFMSFGIYLVLIVSISVFLTAIFMIIQVKKD